jgi:cobalt-zinc-cadmium efflux system outer membrane protein
MPPSCPLRAGCCLLALVGALVWPRAAHGGPGGLTLEEAVRLSLGGPKILAGREGVNQVRAEARSAALLPNPSLTVEAGLLPLSRRYTVEAPGGPTELGAGLSYPIDWLVFRKRAAAMASADAAVGVAEAEQADLVRRRTAETAQAFYGVLEAEGLLAVARQSAWALEQAEAAIRKAAGLGGRPQVDLSRVRLELQSARREERSARSAMVAAKAALRALLGAAPAARDLEVAGTLDVPLTVRPLPVEAAFAVAVENRPDILALRRKGAKARRDVALELRNALPETKLGFGVTRQFQRAIGAPDVTAWGASLEVTLPLFNRNQGGRAKAAAAAAQSGHELAAALAELRADVEQAVQALDTALENAKGIAEADLGLAVQVRDSFRKAYAAGGRSLLEMLDAQRSYRETSRAYITSRADYCRSLVRYHAVLAVAGPPGRTAPASQPGLGLARSNREQAPGRSSRRKPSP